MGQLFKFGSVIGACAFVIAATPVSAGGHFAGHGPAFGPRPIAPRMGVHPAMAFRPGIVPGARGHFGPSFFPRFHAGFHNRFFGRGPGFYGSFGRSGFDYGYAFPRGVRAPGNFGAGLPAGDYAYYATPNYGYPDYPPYPDGYDGASYAPTGNGVVYNVPPPYTCCAPKIIYISGGHVRRETFVRPRQNIVVRGAASVD